MEKRIKSSFPEEALEHLLSLISSDADRNSISSVCKSWYDIERWSRRRVYIPNCKAVNPPILIRRFPNVRSITINDYEYRQLIPKGHALPWIKAVVTAYPELEEIRLNKMVITDEGLDLIMTELKNLRVLDLYKCQGLSTEVLASMASNCRNLRKLGITTEDGEDLGGDWTSFFPDSITSLESLNLSCFDESSNLSSSALERLVGKCPNLNKLTLNLSFDLVRFVSLLLKAPRLARLHIGLYTIEPCPEALSELSRAFAGCMGLKSLHIPWGFKPHQLPAIYPACSGLTFLDIFCLNPDLAKLLTSCPNLRSLSVNACIGDRGLKEVAASCKELRWLAVRPYDLENDYDLDGQDINATGLGLVSVAVGCPKLHSIIYYCSKMSNSALLTVSKHLPNLISLKIRVVEPRYTNRGIQQPFDDGFSAILECCKNLQRLDIECLFTDRLLEQIGTHGKELKVLQLARGGNSDVGLHHVLSGCPNLRKLSLRDCLYSGLPLLENPDRLERMRFILMCSCKVSYRECKLLREKQPRLNVEIIDEEVLLQSMSDESLVKNVFVYRTIIGPELDKA